MRSLPLRSHSRHPAERGPRVCLDLPSIIASASAGEALDGMSGLRDVHHQPAKHLEAGKLTPVLDQTYPLAGTAEGLRLVEQGHARGKVVIIVA